WMMEGYEKAEYFMLCAAGLDPTNAQFLVLLGRALLIKGKYKEVNEFLRIAKGIDLTQPNIYFYQGIALAQLGDVLGTAVQFNAYLHHSPDDLSAHYNRGYAFLQLGMVDWALEDFDKVLNAKPDHYEARARRAVCLLESNPTRAREELKLAAARGSK